MAVKRGTPLARWPFICVILLLLPPLFAALRSSVFETSRWMESDHPRVSEEWEDDE
ncbi:MAG: hypothetical protein M0D55_13000 [Elusimicrobiota bacterium]|nr:MAG: hypothetical protein M0D55_13000 [Elusimicrobiota bacterium]